MARAVTTSVVFTDLVGSTEMASRLGPGATDALRQVHFGLLRGATEVAGGTEVKNLGDGLMVVFESLGAALDGAVAMQQAIARHNDKGAEALGVRIGISTGDATTEDGDYFGEPIVEAARLCAAADGGQILTTQMVSLFARSSGHSFTSVGHLELKGIPEPVLAVEVGWAHAPDLTALGIPLPARLATSQESALVGRQMEWELLQQAYKDVRAGDRRVALISGEPGVGKTRLSSGMCRFTFERGAVGLYGRCDEDLGVPYQPWVEAISHLVEHLPEEVLAAHVSEHGGALDQLVPQLARRVPDLPPSRGADPEMERYVLFQAVIGVLAQAARVSPVVLLLDDLHWADKPTLTLLRHLVAHTSDVPMLILATYRDTDVAKGSALSETLVALRRESGVERLALSGLDDSGVVDLLESIAGHDIGDEGIALAHAIARETGGNPYFVTEILRDLSLTGTIIQSGDGRWELRGDLEQVLLPESVRELVGHRVERLGEDVATTLQAASIIGRDFDLTVLTRVLGDAEDDVFSRLELARDAALIREVPHVEDRFTFRHALVQHALEADVGARRRRQLHQQIAEVLEVDLGDTPGDRVAELAAHWLAATAPVAPAKALHYARLAGEQAIAHLAPDEAIRWFEAAIDLMDHHSVGQEQDRCRLLVGLGRAQRQAGDSGYRQTLLDASRMADQIGDTDSLVTSALANTRGTPSAVGDADEERIAALRSALTAIGERDSPERARLLALLALESTFGQPLVERVRLADEASEIARRLNDPATLADVMITAYYSMLVPPQMERISAAIREARELANHLGDPYLKFWSTIWTCLSALAVANVDEYDRLFVSAELIARDVGQPLLEWPIAYNRSMRACVAGDTDEAERQATLAMEIGTATGQPDTWQVFGAQLMTTRYAQGRSEELIPLIREMVERTPSMTVFKSVLASRLCESGSVPDALVLVEEALASGFHARDDALWSTATANWSFAAAALSHVPAAEVLYPRLAPFEDQIPVTGVNAVYPIAVNLGELAAVLGRLANAERHFEVAEQISAKAKSPFFLARTYLAWATALDRAGEPDRAKRIAQKALSASGGRLGFVEQRCRGLIDGAPGT